MMRSVPKRGSVGLLHELAQQFQADPTLPRFGTDFIRHEVSEFCKTLLSACPMSCPSKASPGTTDKLKFIEHFLTSEASGKLAFERI